MKIGIVTINDNNNYDNKSMVIKITDKEVNLFIDEISPYIDEERPFVQGEVKPFKRK